MIRYIDEHKDQFGVEAICRVLRPAVRGFITSRGYRAAKTRPPSARSLKDELLVPEILRLHGENYGVYGVRKMHALMRRQGWEVGRDQTARLMGIAGVRGVKRSKKVFTTKSDPAAVKPADLVQRRFQAPAPRRLWVADITYVATWSGFAYVAFVTDVYSRRIVGWNVAATLKSDILPLQALDMAAWEAKREGAVDLTGLVHHADHGSNYLSIVYTDRIGSSARSHPREPSGTPSITRSPRPSMGSTRPSSSDGADRGARSSRSSSRPWSTCGGGTTSACTGS